MNTFSFTEIHKDTKTNARLGVIHTPHGDIQTPAFIPVGTQATVKSLTPEEIQKVGTQMFFVNTYHMAMRPGIELVKTMGGLHTFMSWNGPIITDSGGFQVFSLANNHKAEKDDGQPNLVNISEEGVKFRSHWDGSYHDFTPEVSMQYQWELGSDIHIAFDDCTPNGVTKEEATSSMERTHRWAQRSVSAHRLLAHKSTGLYQALYGSIQGSIYEDLRKQSAEFISQLDTDGIAIGGVSVGESKQDMYNVLNWVLPILPKEKPRHLLGVGEIDDIFQAVKSGVDTFDCVQATRLARTGYVYTRQKQKGKWWIDITNAAHKADSSSIDTTCQCYVCNTYSKAYLHHLFSVRELLAYRLATIHNLFFLHRLVRDIHTSIEQGTLLELEHQWLIR